MNIYNLLQICMKIFRFTELFLALIFLLWTFMQLPLVIRISRHYVNQISTFFTNPIFCFIICNTIVATLIAKPRRFNVENELYNVLIKNGSDNDNDNGNSNNNYVFDSEAEEIVYEDKEVISEVNWNELKQEKLGRFEAIWREEGEYWCESVSHKKEISNRELQEQIDAFIERELRFRRQESE